MATPAALLADALKRVGLRATKQRLAVVDALSRKRQPVTAQELHRGLRGADAPGLATIYRTLSALAEGGELDTFDRGGEQAFAICAPGHHHHLVCTSCGSVVEIDGDEVETWVQRVSKRHGFDPSSHRADVYGLCRSCRSARRKR